MSEKKSYEVALGEAFAALDSPQSSDGLIHCSTGVVLTPRKVSPFVFQAVAEQFKDPEIPLVYLEDKGREERNPQNPEYLRKVDEVNAKRSMASIDAIIGLGTKIHTIPEDFPVPEEEDWLDDLESVGITIDRDNKRMRYRTWVRYIAAPSVEDLQAIVAVAVPKSGVTEEAVKTASATFQPQT